MDSAEFQAAPESSPALSIGDILAYHAAKGSSRPAVTWGDVTVGYAELDMRANRKARQLTELGVVQGDIVTIAMPNGIEFYETIFAVWKLGAIPNSVSAKLPPAELRPIVELAKPRLIIADEHATLSGWNILSPGTFPADTISGDPLPSKIAPYWKIATSGGSTGRPKLIVDKLPGVYHPGMAPAHQDSGDTILNTGPLYHNAPFVFSSHCLFAGGHLIEMGQFDPLRALELIEPHRVNWVNFVPTMMHRIWQLPVEQREAFDLSSLKEVWHMASVCPQWLKQAWIDWLGPDRIFELYGGTELTGKTMITGREWLSHKGSVGKVQPGSQMRLVDEDGEECRPGEIGEIYFLPDGGKNSTYEYIGAEAKTIGDWETYGDLGYVDEDHYLYIVDRRTDMIVSGGANIYPAEVEAALDQHSEVISSIVIGLPDADLGHRVHAIVQMKDRACTGEDADADMLRAFLSERLVRYKIPRTFEFTRENLRDDAGKARRSKMRDDRITGELETL